MKNCLNVDSRPLPKVTNACVLWKSEFQQERCFYEHVFCTNVHQTDYLPTHIQRGSKANRTRTQPFGNFRGLRELPVSARLRERVREEASSLGTASSVRCGVGAGAFFINLANCASISGVARSSHSSRINCSRNAVKFVNERHCISTSTFHSIKSLKRTVVRVFLVIYAFAKTATAA